jgi:hypothetical protein
VVTVLGARSPRTRDGRPPPQPAGPGGRWLGRALVAAGLGMIPWLAGLAVMLPGRVVVNHWAAAWTGLDGLEGLSLLVTGVLLLRRDERRCLAATVAATVLAVDAWFDLSTAAPGAGQVIALAMAVLAELPMAVLCAAIALRTLPGGRAPGDDAG